MRSAGGIEVGAVKEPQSLVLAVCHEIGNMVAAVRLQAHLLDEELPPKELAMTSVEIDDLAARMSAMLALVRPLLGSPQRDPGRVSPVSVLSAVRQALEDHGGRGMELQVDVRDDLPAVAADSEVLHHLLLTLVFGAVEAADHQGTVRVTGHAAEESVVFSVEDDAPEDDQLLDWNEHALRGRPLACAAAHAILRADGGRLSVGRDGGLTRVSLALPVAGDDDAC